MPEIYRKPILKTKKNKLIPDFMYLQDGDCIDWIPLQGKTTKSGSQKYELLIYDKEGINIINRIIAFDSISKNGYAYKTLIIPE